MGKICFAEVKFFMQAKTLRKEGGYASIRNGERRSDFAWKRDEPVPFPQ